MHQPHRQGSVEFAVSRSWSAGIVLAVSALAITAGCATASGPARTGDGVTPGVVAGPPEDPARWLESGPLTALDTATAEGLLRRFGDWQSLDLAARVRRVSAWLRRDFEVRTPVGDPQWRAEAAADLIKRRQFSHLRDQSVVMVAALRLVKVPAAMVESIGIDWANRYARDPGGARPFVGRVFVEVWLGDRWVLIDPALGVTVDPYSRSWAAIPAPAPLQRFEKTGFFRIARGLDPADYRLRTEGQLLARQSEVAVTGGLSRARPPARSRFQALGPGLKPAPAWRASPGVIAVDGRCFASAGGALCRSRQDRL